ncbi:glucans biosynthesis glucosyltransferase MdoH [Rhodophyticola sp. CCM32]|uniref:glucans biosynthesis glucosyltransferase MdoH n=1 Tax=Rhodophyticola sp. CCM32 TaxID=2916397 RepID=UPI00107F7ABB|nr:glucans biosynthesis glucosyltransferase MdoH [Rhodophyticola sp. CCM32]QBY01011.1 glucans biosynthesis glucosyltransferase MdoH [Rhodophyticola sp. CCM32]
MSLLNDHHAWMPPAAPLSRPIQQLNRPYRDSNAPEGRTPPWAWLWRLVTFLPAVLTTLALVAAFTDWFAMDGLTGFEGGLIAIISVTFFWIALSVSTATLGIAALIFGPARPAETLMNEAASPMDVALLVPIYNEVPADVFGNAAAMLTGLAAEPKGHSYTLFILSDTTDDAVAALEIRAFFALKASLPGARLHYRRRTANTDGKVGNLADWVEHWGGAYSAMLVLDADSLMCAQAIAALTDALARDPSAGLIQSFPLLYGARTVFGRVQQFSSRVYGTPLAEGLARWTGREGNYWGHNAIIRSAAFAASAGLPRMGSYRGKAGRLILSHDFVEAGLLRRAGWAVRFLPRIGGSYEEAPPTLIDYILRDRRWCQGNLQHLGLLATRGLHPVSRFHMFSGAMGYLLSPAWFMLLVVWALIGNGHETNVIHYFSGVNPQVTWPEMTTSNNLAILMFMYGMLLAPKLVAAGTIQRLGLRLRDLGGLRQFLISLMAEIALSILYAPILMIQQSLAVLRVTFGRRVAWKPQQRKGGQYGLPELMKVHFIETVLGLMLVTGMGLGLVSIWLLPIAVSLAAAIPLSAFSGVDLNARRWSHRHLGTPETLNAPPIIRRALAERRRFADVLNRPASDHVAAE